MKKSKLKYSSYLVITFIVLLSLILGYFIIQKVFIKAPIYEMQNVRLYGKPLLESKLGIKLPQGTIIKHLDVEGWHETDLFALLHVPDGAIVEYVNGISATREPINSPDLNKDVDWWKIKKENSDFKLLQSTPSTEYLIMKSQNNCVSIYIKSWVKLNDEEWKMFNKEN